MTANRPHHPRPYTYGQWMDHPDIACKNTDVNIFYPDRSDSAAAREAKHICWHCPVQTQCLTWALATREPFGVFGGHTPKERELLLDGQRLRR